MRNFHTNKRSRLFALTVLLIILAAAGGILLVFLLGRSDAAPIVRSVSIREIPESSYRDALNQQENSPAWDGKTTPPRCPQEETAKFYQLCVYDKGYSDDLPIDAKIYFAAIPGQGLAEESYFTWMEMPESPRYHNVITYATDAKDDKVFLKLEVHVVGSYDSEGQPRKSEEFAYGISCFCDLKALEVERIHVV